MDVEFHIEMLCRRIVRFARALADLMLPRKCIVCGRNLNLDEQHICLMCMAELPLTYYWKWPHNPMAEKYNTTIQEYIHYYEPYSFACSLFYYSEGNDFRHITHSVKYNGNVTSGIYFGKILGRYMAGNKEFEKADIIIPVPLHWTRQFKRGYNQAEIIAKGICNEMGIRMEPRLLKRRKRTESQTTLDIADKKENVRNAFEIDIDVYEKYKDIKHLLLVDDVFTTGATLYACHCAIRKQYGNRIRISIATLGFVHS